MDRRTQRPTPASCPTCTQRARSDKRAALQLAPATVDLSGVAATALPVPGRVAHVAADGPRTCRRRGAPPCAVRLSTARRPVRESRAARDARARRAPCRRQRRSKESSSASRVLRYGWVASRTQARSPRSRGEQVEHAARQQRRVPRARRERHAALRAAASRSRLAGAAPGPRSTAMRPARARRGAAGPAHRRRPAGRRQQRVVDAHDQRRVGAPGAEQHRAFGVGAGGRARAASGVRGSAPRPPGTRPPRSAAPTASPACATRAAAGCASHS